MAVASVLRQTYRNWELILVDDGSQDESLAVARSFADPRIRVLSDGQNLGLQHRLNQLTAYSTGELIARMDADDLMVEDRIAIQVRQLEVDPMLDVVGSATYLMDEASKLFGIAGTWEFRPKPADILRRGSLWAHPTVMGRRSWFQANQYSTSPEYQRAEDLELWFRTAAHSRFGYSARPLLYYRVDTADRASKIRASLATERRILRRFGPATLGTVGTWVLLGRSHLKSVRIWLIDVLDLNDALKRWKARNLQFESIEACQHEIDEIRTVANQPRRLDFSSPNGPPLSPRGRRGIIR